MFELSIGNEDKNSYTLKEYPPGQFFLQNDEGEGMGITEQQLFELIDKYFKENF